MPYLRTIGQYALVLALALSLNFALPRLAPGDPLGYLVGEDVAAFLSEAERAAVLAEFGLDQPVWRQFTTYVQGVFTGDLGTSVRTGEPVWDAVVARLPWTLLLMGTTLVLSVSIGVVLGVLAAWRRGEGVDAWSLVVTLFCGSLPAFWVAMLLITLFSAELGWLPSFGAYELGTRPGTMAFALGVLERLVLPVTALTIAHTASVLLIARASMASTLERDFILFARAKGVPERRVFYRHALRTALLPIHTHVTIGFGALVGGALVIETVFGYPGLGSLVVDGVGARDYNLLQGVFLLATVSVVAANLVAELTYPLLDPRVRRVS